MIVKLGIIHQNGEEIGVVTKSEEYTVSNTSINYKKDFNFVSKLLLRQTESNLIEYVQSLFDKGYTMDNGYFVYLRFRQTKVQYSMINFAKYVEIVVLKEEELMKDDNHLIVVEDILKPRFLLNEVELQSYFINPYNEINLLQESIKKLLKDEKYFSPKLKNNKETFFTRKKKLRFLR